MKILLTTHQFFPQFTAGTEVLTGSVARELVLSGHTVRIFTGHPGGPDMLEGERFDQYDYDGIGVDRFHHAYIAMGGQKSMIEVGYNNQLAAAYFELLLRSFKPDVIHFFHLNRLGTGLIERAVTIGVPCFLTPTDFWLICPTGQLLLGDGTLCSGPSDHAGNCLKHFAQTTQGGIIGKVAEWLPTAGADWFVRLTKSGVFPIYPKRSEVLAIKNRLASNVSRLNQLNGLVVPTKFMKDLLIGQGVSPNLITEVAFGVDVTTPVMGAQRRNEQDALRVGFIGTLAPHKGCHVLIDAFKQLPQDRVLLKIYGRIEDFPDYTRELQLSVENYPAIEFCGTFSNEKIAHIFSSIDVLVVPSLWYENTPLVLYSAQAAHCPVIASNLSGLAEVIQHDVNGLLFASNCSTDLARQLSRIISESGLQARLSANARTPKSTKDYVGELLTLWNVGR